MLQNEQLHHLIVTSPAKSILWKIYEKTRLRADMKQDRELLKGDRCLLSRNAAMFRIIDSDVFLIGVGTIFFPLPLHCFHN